MKHWCWSTCSSGWFRAPSNSVPWCQSVDRQHVERQRDERPAREAEGAPQPAPAREQHERGAGEEEQQQRRAQSEQQERGGEVADQLVLGHVRAHQLGVVDVGRPEQAEGQQREPDPPARLLARARRAAAARRGRQRAQVEAGGEQQQAATTGSNANRTRLNGAAGARRGVTPARAPRARRRRSRPRRPPRTAAPGTPRCSERSGLSISSSRGCRRCCRRRPTSRRRSASRCPGSRRRGAARARSARGTPAR